MAVRVRIGAVFTATFRIRRVACDSMHAVDFVDGDLPEELDRDGVGVDGEFVAAAQVHACETVSALLEDMQGKQR